MNGGLRFAGKRLGGKSDGVQVDNAEHSRYERRDALPPATVATQPLYKESRARVRDYAGQQQFSAPPADHIM